jgi:hypothetical protein
MFPVCLFIAAGAIYKNIATETYEQSGFTFFGARTGASAHTC